VDAVELVWLKPHHDLKMKDASALHPDHPCARHAARGIPVLELALSRGALSAQYRKQFSVSCSASLGSPVLCRGLLPVGRQS
jgi:hypothetical protein